jgi:kynurenine 3-monooxygenase
VLIEAAARHAGVAVHFSQHCLGADASLGHLSFRDADSGREYQLPLTPTIATDGAGSAIRASLAAAGLLQVREEWLDHDYKELTIPAESAGALERHALHIWPRGGFMLIALPNTDGSFTATLFLARAGPVSFAALAQAEAVQEFFAREFSDALPLLPDLPAQFAAHPQGQLGTVHAAPWHLRGDVLLLGDAAHAIVPFHGQGMNAAFEDCTELDALLDPPRATAPAAPYEPPATVDWGELFGRFEPARRPNAAAIAQMALENYLEMRDAVLDVGFVRRKQLAMALERRFPDRFIPRYSMVMFHPEIPYAEAQRRGAVQEQLLHELDQAGGGDAAAGSSLAERLVSARLTPLAVGRAAVSPPRD